VLSRGAFLRVPRGTPHTFRNSGDDIGRVVGTFNPGTFANYSRARRDNHVHRHHPRPRCMGRALPAIRHDVPRTRVIRRERLGTDRRIDREAAGGTTVDRRRQMPGPERVSVWFRAARRKAVAEDHAFLRMPSCQINFRIDGLALGVATAIIERT
jgi:hypothetical protein